VGAQHRDFVRQRALLKRTFKFRLRELEDGGRLALGSGDLQALYPGEVERLRSRVRHRVHIAAPGQTLHGAGVQGVGLRAVRDRRPRLQDEHLRAQQPEFGGDEHPDGAAAHHDHLGINSLRHTALPQSVRHMLLNRLVRMFLESLPGLGSWLDSVVCEVCG
jgi:hypothetical protein